MVDCCKIGKEVFWDRSCKSFVMIVEQSKNVPLVGVIGLPERVHFSEKLKMNYCRGCGKKFETIPNREIKCKHMEMDDNPYNEAKMLCNNDKQVSRYQRYHFKDVDEYYCMTCPFREEN